MTTSDDAKVIAEIQARHDAEDVWLQESAASLPHTRPIPAWHRDRATLLRLLQSRAPATTAGHLPDDVRRLVIAARIVAFESQDDEAIKELDAASEAFAARIPWEDEPEETT